MLDYTVLSRLWFFFNFKNLGLFSSFSRHLVFWENRVASKILFVANITDNLMPEINTAILVVTLCTLFQFFELAFITILSGALRALLAHGIFTNEQSHAPLANLKLFMQWHKLQSVHLVISVNPCHLYEFPHAIMTFVLAIDVTQLTLAASLCGCLARRLLQVVDLAMLVKLQRIARGANIEGRTWGGAFVVICGIERSQAVLAVEGWFELALEGR